MKSKDAILSPGENGELSGISNPNYVEDTAVIDASVEQFGTNAGSQFPTKLPNNETQPEDSPKTPESQEIKKLSCSGRVKDWFTSTYTYVYISHFLSAWGDRMWGFGVSLFLILISPDSLQLTASYGLANGVTILLLGAIVGDWVDNTPRLKAAQLSLILQNVMVLLCAVVLFLHLTYPDEVKMLWSGWLQTLSFVVIIILAILSNVFSLARVIAVEKDWIVEICGKDKDMLAKMTSTLRRIDLATKIIAPIATGAIMDRVGVRSGAAFIGGWNLVSVFLEYYLMAKVYSTVPALSKKKYWTKKDRDKAAKEEEEQAAIEKDETEKETDIGDPDSGAGNSKPNDDQKVVFEIEGVEVDETLQAEKETTVSRKEEEVEKEKEKSCCSKVLKKCFSSFITLYHGWRTYMRYDVANAGLGLACLFLTVLGFDNITTGFAYTQGICQWMLGVFQGTGAVIGIIGTIAYPAFRKCVGLERTGLFALACQISCLSLCVLSVFMPGSPFDPLFFTRDHSESNVSSTMTAGANFSVATVPTNFNGSTVSLTLDTTTSVSTVPDCNNFKNSYISIALLMAGIITARFGLWIADLTISQLFLERVEEQERGKVNGVQGSLNKLADMLKFALVVALPQPQVFGYLVFISFAFICLGFGFYASYSRKARGHLLPFHYGCNKKKESSQAAAA